MTTKFSLILRIFYLFLMLITPQIAWADSSSIGYQLALIDERAQNPQKVLTQKKINPSDAAVREFEWILETLRNRCPDSQTVIVTSLVEAWRATQKRGYKVTLLKFSRQIADFSTLAFQSRRNQKFAFSKLVYKVLNDKYPIP